MKFRPASAAITLALLCPALAPDAQAGERKLFENVRGWEVERNVGVPGPNACQMAYSYKDKDDKNAENAIVVTLKGDKLVLILGYENWEWDKDEAVPASMSVDKQVVYAKQGWTGDGKLLSTELPEAVIPRLLKGKQIVLKFDDGEADFRIPGFADAFDGLKRCDAAAATPAPTAAPATPIPPSNRIEAYLFGLLLQRTVATCDVSTTGVQRTALDAKVAALRPEMAPIEAAVQEQMKAPDVGCPKAGTETAQFETELSAYLTQTPEDYAASAAKRSAERKAAAETAKVEAEMRAKIEAQMRAEAETKRKAEADAQAKAEMEARIRAEVEAKLRAEAAAAAQAPKP